MTSRTARWNWVPLVEAERAALTYTVVGACHISSLELNESGYAIVRWTDLDGAARMTSAHRAAFAYFRRHPMPHETVDHILGVCSDRRCVRWSHLRLLPSEENSARAGQIVDWAPGTCRRGHQLDGRFPCSRCAEEIRTLKLRGKTNREITEHTGWSEGSLYRLLAPPRPRVRQEHLIDVGPEPAVDLREVLVAPADLARMQGLHRAGAVLRAL